MGDKLTTEVRIPLTPLQAYFLDDLHVSGSETYTEAGVGGDHFVIKTIDDHGAMIGRRHHEGDRARCR